uniref:protein mono-ADP-ribosyltransferase PARP12b isoform X2 n=1 Tax=Monopterus albus TaxID=43700 RepID=UPI0009B448E0|nr:poly [ADP-ribose] polymerase 12-like isoform X2 [Monopterus albus]
MAAYSRTILLATRVLCSSGGAMQLLQLREQLLETCDITEQEFFLITQECSRFLVLGLTVVAQTSLRLCRSYGREEPGEAGACQDLHLCKFFIYGNCKFGKGRKLCKFSHDIQSHHNWRVLRDCTLHELDEDDLFLLLLQNDPTLLPEVCSHYNRGSGPYGCCTFKSTCTKVHLCQHFVQGDCMFGHKCKRQHAIDEHGRRVLEERGLSGDIIHRLPFVYRNKHYLTAATASTLTEKSPDFSTKPAVHLDETDILCLHFIRNSCKFRNECHQVHFHLPYKWEVLVDETWVKLQHMEDIERDFCDPSKSQSSGDRPVDFLTMTWELRHVRRLSTVSSVRKPPHYMLTTEWLWYYKVDQEKWIEYGQPDDRQRTTSVTSRILEERFLADRTADVKVVKGKREYIISFKDMYQRNLNNNTKRKVQRRPRFVSVAQIWTK